MASQHLFTIVTQNFNASVAAGAGSVTQWTYTVPSGKRAILGIILVKVEDNANAVNTTQAQINVNAIAALRKHNDGAGNNTLEPNVSLVPRLNLNEGDIVTGITVNTGAAAVVMQVAMIAEEYG